MEPQYDGNVTPTFSHYDDRLINGRWILTGHARERMGDRGITLDQVAAVLKNPGTNVPSNKPGPAGIRVYAGDGLTLTVDEAANKVITVGIGGASRHDWESHPAPQSSAPLREPETPAPTRLPRRAPKRRTDPHVAPVTSTRVPKRLWDACLARADGDVRRLRVLANGEVMILNQPR